MKDFLNVYITKIPFECDDIFSIERKQYISKANNENVIRDRFYSWKLLETAIENSVGISIKDVQFKRKENEKWVCDVCEFSISHGHGFACVAISNKNVGVDIECDDGRDYEKLKQMVLLPQEKCETIDEFLKIWTAKEAIFKSLDTCHFNPKDYDTTQADNFLNQIVEINGQKVILSVCSENINLFKIFIF